MNQAEYEAWVPGAIEAYAADHERNGSRPPGQALEIAKEEFAKLLPDGLATAEHYLLVGTVTGSSGEDEPVGMLWLYIPKPPPGGGSSAFVYDVEVHADKRGSGYGKGIMQAAEQFARDHGANAIRLHVFGDNTVAIGLYERLGYRPTNISMTKVLG
jgi:ribosomal protein S18 acetylase RimI-like enzyme